MSVKAYTQQILGMNKYVGISEEERAEISADLIKAGANAPQFLVVKHKFTGKEEAKIIRGLFFRNRIYVHKTSVYIFGKTFQIIEKCEGVPNWASEELVRLAKELLK